jgi:hypothetical protein
MAKTVLKPVALSLMFFGIAALFLALTLAKPPSDSVAFAGFLAVAVILAVPGAIILTSTFQQRGMWIEPAKAERSKTKPRSDSER